MINSGERLARIVEKLAGLKAEIELNGLAGLTNIHTHSENLVRDILNIVYAYNLRNLNDKTANAAALDLGDDSLGIAFQVTAEKGSGKINETLNRVLDRGFHKTYPNIRFFIIGKKQDAYAITAAVSTLIKFDWKSDILDFGDIVKAAKNLDLPRLNELSRLLDDELTKPPTVLSSSSAVKEDEKKLFIDIDKSISATKCNFYSHSIAVIQMENLGVTLPKMLQVIKDARNAFRQPSTELKRFLWLLEEDFRAPSSNGKKVIYHGGTRNAGGLFHEQALIFQANTISFEFAQYKAILPLFTNLMEELAPVIIFIFLCKRLYGETAMKLNLSFSLSSNGKLMFRPESSILSVKKAFTDYILDPSPFEMSIQIEGTDDDSIIKFLENIVSAFMMSGKSIDKSGPFMSVFEGEQKLLLNHFRALCAQTLSEIW